MRRVAAAALATAMALGLAACGSKQPTAQASSAAPRQTSPLMLTSSAFADGQAMPLDYTCDGTGRSPPLAWKGEPVNTRSFALVVEDPDAPKGTFRHWGAYDIPGTTHELAAGAAQDGASGFKETSNDFGHGGYGPPCPPGHNEAHHYHFRLMALDIARLPGSPADVKALLDATKGHVIDSTELVATYASP